MKSMVFFVRNMNSIPCTLHVSSEYPHKFIAIFHHDSPFLNVFESHENTKIIFLKNSIREIRKNHQFVGSKFKSHETTIDIYIYHYTTIDILHETHKTQQKIILGQNHVESRRTMAPWASAEPVVGSSAGGFSSTACDVHMKLWFRDSTCW